MNDVWKLIAHVAIKDPLFNQIFLKYLDNPKDADLYLVILLSNLKSKSDELEARLIDLHNYASVPLMTPKENNYENSQTWRDSPHTCPECGGNMIYNWKGHECASMWCFYVEGKKRV